ncbi:hypothetical protein [Pandoraea apista]|uniref:Transmembrane protein n=1 Tax=Pandoraea apista TaxID=93218 RepID=A0ABX9ZMD6_9BURK|nr:hypothetical protein [Pandoraea apista]RRJ30429.1 hypothetical protein EIB05_14700 [Pandoraea apista]RRJ74424.1 hypothetical protein EIL82_15585 [Pandoraea apista]RSD09853.1 hypothetical protein EJB12_14870 [Pandoraea apista]RSD12930.1 hypothetical protein EIZ52_19235 [Pandoraea apista]RSK78886.1 hypothetical protein EJE83_16165 [Pandoraea apista]
MSANTPNTPDTPHTPDSSNKSRSTKAAPPRVTPPPPGAMPLAWVGLLAAAAWVLKSPHPTWGVGVLCLCAGLISSFGARRRGRMPWPAFFTGLLPVGVALFFALLMLRPLFR